MKKSVVAAILIIVILAAGVFGVTAYASDWYRLPVEEWGDRLGIGTDKPADEEKPDDETPGGVVDGDGNVMDPTGINVMPMAMTFNTASVSGATGSTVTITATISPDNATNKNVTWTIAWENPSSSWASGKTVTDYVTVTPNTSDSRIATVTCKQAFGEQVIITATAAGNTSIYQTCTADYEKRLQGMNGLYISGKYIDMEYSLFDKNLTIIRPTGYSFNHQVILNEVDLSSDVENFNEFIDGWDGIKPIDNIVILDRIEDLIGEESPIFSEGTIGGFTSLQSIEVSVDNGAFLDVLTAIGASIDQEPLTYNEISISGLMDSIEENSLNGNFLYPFSPGWILSLMYQDPMLALNNMVGNSKPEYILRRYDIHSQEDSDALFEQFENGDETELRSIADMTLDFVMSDGTKITQYVIFDFSQYLIPISNITLDKGSIVF